MRRRLLLPLLITGVAACHPLACCAPADFPKDKPFEFTSTSKQAPKEAVDMAYDELGIPHLYGETENDLAYGLGWMHGRDRQFQVYIYVHAGEGRLTELLGEDLLEIDRQNRLLTFRLDEQLEALSERDRDIIDSYAAGINDGAVFTGQSAEMRVLGVEWEELDARDVLAVMRLQQWDQSSGFAEEMGRWRMSRQIKDDDVFAELTQDSPTGGHPIVDDVEHTGETFAHSDDRPERFHRAPAASSATTSPAGAAEAKALIGGALRDVKIDVGGRFGRRGQGASNEWVVDGLHNSSGFPVLVNDPHLSHSAPGVFYMVHMEGPDFTVAGGSFPGIPAVLIGHGRHLSWGITNAFADVQDVVELRPFGQSKDLYEVDGAPISFTTAAQRFRIGKGAGAVVIKEDYLVSVFGPVLPKNYGTYAGEESWVDDDERLALQWTAFAFPEEGAGLISSFWDLAKSKNIAQAHAAVQKFTAPAMSIAIAIAANDEGPAGIHYRLSGIVPVRGSDQRVDFPRKGTTRNAGFVGVLPAEQKPQIDNPERGFIVAANQRVVANDSLSQRFVGYESARPFRAMRIHERLAKAFEDDNKPTPEELLAIQQDVVSIEARELAPIFKDHCPKKVDGYADDVVARFCDAVGDFDGSYDVDSNASAFTRYYRALQENILAPHMGKDLAADVVDESWCQMSMFALLKKAGEGEDVASFDLDDVSKLAAKDALDLLAAETGTNDEDWRYGKLHTLKFRGVLASAPVIGGLFETGSHEEGGTGSAPRAENASFSQKLRVTFGAGLRNFAILSDKPEVKLVNDIGNSGHFGHRHLEDQYPLWTKGEPVKLHRSQDNVTETNDGLLKLLPKD